MNNRLRSAVFPSSLLKLIILLKKVTARGIESRLRRVMTGERGKTTFNFSNGNIGFYDLLLMIITTRTEGGDTLSLYLVRPRVAVEVYFTHVLTADSTCELSPAPEPGACEKL